MVRSVAQLLRVAAFLRGSNGGERKESSRILGGTLLPQYSSSGRVGLTMLIRKCRRLIAHRGLRRREDQSTAAWAPFTITCCMMMSVGLVVTMRPSSESSPSSAKHCLMEGGDSCGVPPRRRTIRRNRRPPEFGAKVPKLTTTRGVVNTNRNDTSSTNDDDTTASSLAVMDEEEDRVSNCPMCKQFSRGPCGIIFQRWLACTDCHTGKVDYSTGEPLHLSKCADFAVELAECLDENTDYYNKDEYEEEIDVGQQLKDSSELKDAWTVFVNEMEDCILSGKYTVQPFTATLDPKIKIRANTTTGAAFFVLSSENENDEQQQHRKQQPILVAAYILDNKSNVIAAGSQEDMYMDDELGCVLQFKISDGMKSVTARAIYDTTASDDGILIFSRTILVPV